MSPRVAALGLLLALAGACSEELAATPVIPDAVELTENAVLRGTHDIEPHGDGWAVVWSELPAEERESVLYFALLDAEGSPIDGPRRVATIPDRWPVLQLLVTPTGFNVWHAQAYREPGVIVFDPLGNELTRAVTTEIITSNGAASQAAVVGDAVLHVYDSNSGAVRFRVYNDQGVPRTDIVGLGAGGSPRIIPRADRFDVFYPDARQVYRVSILPTGEIAVPAAAVASDPESMWGIDAVPVGDAGAFLGWRRAVSPADGAAFSHFDVAGGWAESRTLYASNRRESHDFYLGTDAGRVLVVWQSDAEHAVPELLLGAIDPAGGELAIASQRPLTPSGFRGGSCRLAEGPAGAALMFSAESAGQSRLYFMRVGP